MRGYSLILTINEDIHRNVTDRFLRDPLVRGLFPNGAERVTSNGATHAVLRGCFRDNVRSPHIARSLCRKVAQILWRTVARPVQVTFEAHIPTLQHPEVLKYTEEHYAADKSRGLLNRNDTWDDTRCPGSILARFSAGHLVVRPNFIVSVDDHGDFTLVSTQGGSFRVYANALRRWFRAIFSLHGDIRLTDDMCTLPATLVWRPTSDPRDRGQEILQLVFKKKGLLRELAVKNTRRNRLTERERPYTSHGDARLITRLIGKGISK